MKDRWKIVIVAVFALVGLGMLFRNAIAEKPGGEIPIRTVTISLKEDARDQFFDQLEKFSSNYGFTIRISPTRPDGRHFLIQMSREDTKVIGTNPFDELKFDISFYRNSRSIEPKSLDAIIAGLEEFSSQVPGTTVSNRK